MSNLLEAAIDYASNGYRVFPCKPGLKTPLTARGFHDATTDLDQVEAWWTVNPEANIGIATGNATVIDIDPVDGRENPWISEGGEQVLELFSGIQSITPRGGRHIWLRTPADATWRNSAGKIAPGVDVRSTGGYVLAPPSRVKDEKSDGVYSWIQDAELDCPPSGLPDAPKWLVAKLDTNERETLAPGGRSAWDAGEAPTIGEGQRDNALTSMAGNLRHYGHTEAEILALLRATNSTRVIPPMGDSELKRIAWSVSRYQPDQLSAFGMLVEPMEFTVNGQGEAGDDLESEAPVDPGLLPEKFLKCGGFLGRYIETATKHAFRPQPILALAAGLSLVSTLIGRKLTDRYGTRSNVYVLGVAPSGSGKEFARQLTKRILVESGSAELIGPEGWASHAGIVTAVESRPAQLQQIDEIGRVLEAINNNQAGSHLFHIATVLMKLYSSAGSVYLSDGYADQKRNLIIQQPCLSVYGTTVAESLLEGLSVSSMSDGFLARMLIFPADLKTIPERNRDAGLDEIPADLIEFAKQWNEFKPGGNLSGIGGEAVIPEPAVVSFSDEALERFNTFLDFCDTNQRAGNCEGSSSIWARAGEKAHKIALIKAASDAGGNIPTEITREAAEYGCELVEFLTRQLLSLADGWVSDGIFDKTQLKILRAVKDSGDKGLTLTQITHKTRGLKPFDRAQMLLNLEQAGYLVKAIVPTKTKTRSVYKWAKAAKLPDETRLELAE